MSNIKGYIVAEEAISSSPKIVKNYSTILNESHNSDKNVVKFEAELQEADAPNRNGRIYDRAAIVSALNHYSIKEKLKHKTFYGEASHPLSSDVKRQMYIDQSNISHIVDSVRWEGNHLLGLVETANTNTGNNMAGLIRQGSDVAFSMRGIGTAIVKEGSYQRVKSPLYIVSYDWVVIPSHANSYMQHILGEDTQSSINKHMGIKDINMTDALEYVSKNSENVHAMVESFGFSTDVEKNMSISEDNSVLTVKQENEGLKIFLENSIRSNLDSYFSEKF